MKCITLPAPAAARRTHLLHSKAGQFRPWIPHGGPAPLRRFLLPALAVAAFLLLAFLPKMRAQTLSGLALTAAPLEDRRKALNALFEEYWQATMEHSPEYASVLGDVRYFDDSR